MYGSGNVDTCKTSSFYEISSMCQQTVNVAVEDRGAWVVPYG